MRRRMHACHMRRRMHDIGRERGPTDTLGDTLGDTPGRYIGRYLGDIGSAFQVIDRAHAGLKGRDQLSRPLP